MRELDAGRAGGAAPGRRRQAAHSESEGSAAAATWPTRSCPRCGPSRVRARLASPLRAGSAFEPANFDKGPAGADRPGEFEATRTFGPSFGVDKPFRPARPARPVGEGFRPRQGSPEPSRGPFGAKKFGANEVCGLPRPGPARPAWKKDDRGPRPPARFAPGAGEERRPYAGQALPETGPRPVEPMARTDGGASPQQAAALAASHQGRPFVGRPASGKPSFGKPAWTKPGSGRSPQHRPPFHVRPRLVVSRPFLRTDFTPFKPAACAIDPVDSGSFEARGPRTFSKPPVHLVLCGLVPAGRSSIVHGRASRASANPDSRSPRRVRYDRGSDRPPFRTARLSKSLGFDRGGSAGPTLLAVRGAEGSAQSRPPRGESGTARPFTTSSGKPRRAEARGPHSKPLSPGNIPARQDSRNQGQREPDSGANPAVRSAAGHTALEERSGAEGPTDRF